MNNATWDAKQYPNSISVLDDEFHQKVQASCMLVQMYEDPFLQQSARAVIPADLLQARARERHASTSTSDLALQSSSRSPDLMDCLLLELLAWFKEDFFRWFDAPTCSKCALPMANVGHVAPSAEEMRWGGSRVEDYRCPTRTSTGNVDCQTANARFPRFNHPGKLLETRIGRCGEWANCFTLCCVSLGFEARYVLDWTDHVWTEVYSVSQARWLHCDPCENLCDSPLVYESGWNKKLTYVIAFSKDDIQDVTWRYSSRHAEVLSRRLMCHETWLLQMIVSMRRQLQANARPSRKTQLDQRLVVELVEFLSPKRAATKDGEIGGRVSGSLDWRRARGEIGDHVSSTVFELTDAEVTSRKFHLRYCSATDTYLRSDVDAIQGWVKGVHRASNVFRKVETDWRQVYLARLEGAAVGRVSWKVVVGAGRHDLTVKTVSVRCDTALYENGAVSWKICARDKCVRVSNGQDSVPFVTRELSGEREVTIEAELSGGRGSVSWQHAQLFRLSLNDTDKYPFDVCITFN